MALNYGILESIILRLFWSLADLDFNSAYKKWGYVSGEARL